MEQNKKVFFVFTYKSSHIDIVCPGTYDIFLKKYTPQKFNNIIDLIEELVDLNNNVKQKTSIIILFDRCYINESEIKTIKNNKILTNLSILKLNVYEDSSEDYLKFWSNLMAQIQQKLTNINICFLFTTYKGNKDYKRLLSICGQEGLKNFRFITEPFFVKDLEKSMDNLLLRHYMSKVKRSMKKKYKNVS